MLASHRDALWGSGKGKSQDLHMGILRNMVYRLSYFIEQYGIVGWFMMASVNLFVIVLAWSVPVILFNPWAPYLSRSQPPSPVDQTVTEPTSPSNLGTMDAIMAQVVTLTPTIHMQPGLIYEAGTYLVLEEIEPGIYRGQGGPDSQEACYWARLRDLTEAFESIIAADTRQGQFYLEIKPSDAAVQVYCAITSLDPNLPQVSSYAQHLSPGMYLIGADILPGQYRGQTGERPCAWERLSGVDGEPNSLIASGDEAGDFVLDVLPSDFAVSTDCELERISE
jgi:hypothetical protein